MLLGYLDVHNLQAPMGRWSMRPKDSHLTTWETTVTRFFLRHLSCNNLKHQLSSRFHNKMGHGSHSFQGRVLFCQDFENTWRSLTFPPRPKACEDTVKYVTHAGLNPLGSGKWMCFYSGFLQEVRDLLKGGGLVLGLRDSLPCWTFPLQKIPEVFQFRHLSKGVGETIDLSY